MRPIQSLEQHFPWSTEHFFPRVLDGIWSTSDMEHAVAGPRAVLGGRIFWAPANISIGRYRELLCTLFYEASQSFPSVMAARLHIV